MSMYSEQLQQARVAVCCDGIDIDLYKCVTLSDLEHSFRVLFLLPQNLHACNRRLRILVTSLQSGLSR
jgi:hypothetical protein